MTHENYMKFYFHFLQVKFYWDIIMLIEFGIIYVCLCATVEELSSCDRLYGPQKLK